MKAPYFESETQIKLVKSWLCPLLVCEQDKAASKKGSVLHTTVVMKGLGRENKSLQHSIIDLSPGIPTQTDEAFTVDERKHTHTHTHTHTCNQYVRIMTLMDLTDGHKLEINVRKRTSPS